MYTNSSKSEVINRIENMIGNGPKITKTNQKEIINIG
jgi:hypothetical protein